MDLMLLLLWGPWVQKGKSWALVRHAVGPNIRCLTSSKALCNYTPWKARVHESWSEHYVGSEAGHCTRLEWGGWIFISLQCRIFTQISSQMLTRICQYRCEQWHSVQVSWIVRTHCFNSRQSILKIWVPQSSPVLSFSLTQSVTLIFTVLGLRGGLCMRSWRCSLQLVKQTIPCHNSCLYLWQWPSSKPVQHETKNRRPATYNWSPKIAMSTHSLKFSTVRYKMVPRVPSPFRFTSKNLGPRKG